MGRVYFLPLLLFSLKSSHALALAIGYGGVDSPMPFEVVHEDVGSPLEIALQITNASEMAATVLAWQLELELRALNDAQGNLLFYDVSSPPDPLFSQSSGPQSNPNLPPPVDDVFVQEMDMQFVGVPVPPQSAQNILQLTLMPSHDANGAFGLMMHYADDPESDSSWFDADAFTPQRFENSPASAFPGRVLLGTIHISPDPSILVGDYDSDGEITSMDYRRWRSTFAASVDPAGWSADGNKNRIIDAADYVLWRRYVGMESGAASEAPHSIVPEPASILCASLSLAVLGLLRRERGRASPLDQ